MSAPVDTLWGPGHFLSQQEVTDWIYHERAAAQTPLVAQNIPVNSLVKKATTMHWVVVVVLFSFIVYTT